VTIPVLDNDMDPDSDVLSVLDVGEPLNGGAVVLADGDIRYTPHAGFAGVDSLTYTIGDGLGGFDSATVVVFVEGEPPPSACTDVIGSALLRSRVRFASNGDPQFAYFWGALVQTEGNVASDFRTDDLALGALTVTFGDANPVVAYENTNIEFSVLDCNPADNREKWRFRESSTEKVTLRWKNTQHYDANRDPGLPDEVGSLSTAFIHADETRFRFEVADATLPITIVVDGIVLVTVDEAGGVSSALPFWCDGDEVDVLFPDRLVPGNTIEWYGDGDPSDGVSELIYSHEATADGTGNDTYFEAGGRFWIKVPIAGITRDFPERTARVEFSMGEPGNTLVGCGEFEATEYSEIWNNWVYGAGDD